MTNKQCKACGGILQYTGSDSRNSYYECPHCGAQETVTIASQGGVNLAYEKTKQELMSKLQRGFENWTLTNWDHLYKEFVDFICSHDYLQNDLRFQAAILACMTHGFNFMDENKYKSSKALFKVTEKMYKQQVKNLKKNGFNAALSESVKEYESCRGKYIKVQHDYINGNMSFRLVR
jgi:hypothetical protein